MGKQVWVVLAVMLAPQLAGADKLDDAVARTHTAYDAWRTAETHYKDLFTSWERYYKPIDDQWPVVVAARKKAEDECAKNKRTKNCRDFTLAYAAEQKKYNALVADKDAADPKQQFSREALKPADKDRTEKKTVFEAEKARTITLFEDAYKKAKTKAQIDQIDAKLAVKEEKRGDKFAAGRSSSADAKNPGGSSSSSSSGSSRTNGYDPTKTITDTINRW